MIYRNNTMNTNTKYERSYLFELILKFCESRKLKVLTLNLNFVYVQHLEKNCANKHKYNTMRVPRIYKYCCF